MSFIRPQEVADIMLRLGVPAKAFTVGDPLDSNYIPTVGSWWPIFLSDEADRVLAYDADRVSGQNGAPEGTFKEMQDLKKAFHGSGVERITSILSVGLQVGPTHTAGALGVYCEGEHRRQNCLNYMTHMSLDNSSPYVWSVLFECVADRQFGKTIHKQWCQSAGSIVVTGVMLHVINICDVYEKGFQGWFRVLAHTLDQYSGGRKYSDNLTWRKEEQPAPENAVSHPAASSTQAAPRTSIAFQPIPGGYAVDLSESD